MFSVLLAGAATSSPSARRSNALNQDAAHKGKTGAVASLSSVCSHIGIALIEGGGSAADAVHYLLVQLLHVRPCLLIIGILPNIDGWDPTLSWSHQ